MSNLMLAQPLLTFGELFLTLGVLQVLLFAPLWFLTYLAVRAITPRHPTHPFWRWIRGILAWGVVASYAPIDRRYAPIARRRLFFLFNGLLLAGLAFFIRPDLAMPLLLFVAVWVILYGLLGIAKRYVQRPHQPLPLH